MGSTRSVPPPTIATPPVASNLTPARAVLRGLLGAFVAAGVVGGLLGWRFGARVDAAAESLEAIAAEAAAGVDGVAHARVRSPEDATGADFAAIRHDLSVVAERHRLRSPLYTLRRDGEATRFVVMTNETAFVGGVYALRDEMRDVFDHAERARTGLYGDDHGHWVSGYAPVLGSDGSVEALVSVDHPADDLAAAWREVVLWSCVAGVLGGLLGILLPLMLGRRTGVVGTARRFVTGSLALRIGLSGSVAVLVAVGAAGLLNYRAARAEVVHRIQERLGTAVSVGAHQIDAAAHARVAASGDAGSADFEAVRAALRRIQEAAGLTSPVYTLRRDGALTRFVGMTNETPFVGDSNELRPGVRTTFESGRPGAEGPYGDAHGTWISAWAPLRDPAGEVVGVIQADAEVGALLLALRAEAVQQVLFALIGVALAFLAGFVLARSIARPIAEVAEAADRIRTGDFSVRVDEGRGDEVGVLSSAINRMAEGLAERERLRGMFGRYMANQVVQALLDEGELRLTGELRPLTVIISDIRGYTALTEELGAEEVVALLNDYFAILVREVVARDGVVDKFMGDAMLCWFGAPAPQPDHGQRAADTCVAIMRALDVWNAGRVEKGLAPVLTGIGVASGPVVVGNIGSHERLEYTAIGDAVNLASRLCSKAAAGEVLVSDSVRQAVLAPFEVVGEVPVKGVRDPVLVHRLGWRDA